MGCDSDGEMENSGGRMSGGREDGIGEKEREWGSVREEGVHDFVLTSKI